MMSFPSTGSSGSGEKRIRRAVGPDARGRTDDGEQDVRLSSRL